MEHKNDIPQLNKTALIAVTMLSNFMNPLMGSAVNIALPKISAEFSMGAIALSWITMSYLLASAIFLVPFGKIADIYGRRKVFFLGNLFFMLSTFLCSISFNGMSLIVFRFLQGFAGAMMFSTSMALVISAFPLHERGKAIGLNVSAVYIGLSLAPLLGGLFTEYMGWRSLFYINASVSVLITAVIYFKIKYEWKEAEGEKFDFKGTILYMPSIAALMYGFSKLPQMYAIIITLMGLFGLIAFVLIEIKHPNPVLNIKLFIQNKVFASSNLSAFINYAATFAVGFILSLYLQYVKGMSPKEAGMLLITQPVLMALVAAIAGRLSDKIKPNWLASAGMAISVAGLFMLSLIGLETSQHYIIISLAVLGLGFGLFSSPNTNMVMSSVEKKFYGIASATLGTMRTTGMMFSMAIASLCVFWFVGKNTINATNINAFIQSTHLIFIIFTGLCTLGVFTSFVGKKELKNI